MSKHNSTTEEVHVLKIVKLLTLVAVILLPSMLLAQWAGKEYWPETDKPLPYGSETFQRTITIAGKTYKINIKKELWVNPNPDPTLQDAPVKAQIYGLDEGGATFPTWHEIAKFTVDPVSIPDDKVGWRTSRYKDEIYVAIPPKPMVKEVKEPGTTWKRGAFVRKLKTTGK